MEKTSRSSSGGSKRNRVGVMEQCNQEETIQVEPVPEIETTQVETISEQSFGSGKYLYTVQQVVFIFHKSQVNFMLTYIEQVLFNQSRRRSY